MNIKNPPAINIKILDNHARRVVIIQQIGKNDNILIIFRKMTRGVFLILMLASSTKTHNVAAVNIVTKVENSVY